MTRLNVLLLMALLASAFYLVRMSYDARRLFSALDRAQAEARQLDSDHERLQAERQAQATPLRVEQTAREKLAHAQCHAGRHPLPGCRRPVCHGGGQRGLVRSVERPAMKKLLKRSASPAAGGGNVRSLNYSTSPLLASRTPAWRSRFLVALVGAGFLVLIGRALYVQVIGNDFFLKQGEIRYARTLDLSASRGRILDRNGVILASSVPTPSLWAIPKDLEATDSQRLRLARLLGMSTKELDDQAGRQQQLRLAAPAGRRGAGQGRAGAGHQGRAPGARVQAPVPRRRGGGPRGGLHQRRGQGPGGHRAGLPERPGRPERQPPRHQGPLGRVVEDMGDSVAALDGPRHLAVDRLQGAVLCLPAHPRRRGPAQGQGRQRGGARRADRRGAGAGQLPELRPRRPPQADRRAAAQPRHDRHLRARLDDEAAGDGLGAGDRPRQARHGARPPRRAVWWSAASRSRTPTATGR